MYVGVALRDRAHGDKSAISGSHLLYIECDDPDAGERLEDFACSPSMIVASGSPGHLHVYWRLRERASTATSRAPTAASRCGLQGEPGCVDIVRVLRPPATLNHKHRPPVPVRLLEHDASARYALAESDRQPANDPSPTHVRPPGGAPPRRAHRA